VPYPALCSIKYIGITKAYHQFKEDATNGTLPAVLFLDPRYTILDDGTGTTIILIQISVKVTNSRIASSKR
jgi:hypothetical protein